MDDYRYNWIQFMNTKQKSGIVCFWFTPFYQATVGGVSLEGMDDWFEEKFVWVIRYVADMFLDVSTGTLATEYIASLSDSVSKIITDSAASHHICKQQLSRDWLSEIATFPNSWLCLRYADLFRRVTSLRGVIFYSFWSGFVHVHPKKTRSQSWLFSTKNCHVTQV